MFFIDKYAPKTAKDSILHKDILKLLEFISNDDSIPHIIFYGNDGVGKRRIIKLFLEMLYGNEVNNIEENLYTVIGSGNKVKKVFVKQSDYHIMIDPVDNNFDKYLIQDVVKEYAKRIQINLFKSKKIFKSVMINNLDNLSYYAQTSLRRTMEKYSGTCRFIMWCRSLSKVIEPLKSRCICIRISAPSNDELLKLALHISAKENINLNLDDYTKLLNSSYGSVRKLLWKLNLIKAGQKSKINTKFETPLDETIEEITDLVIKCDLKEISNIRNLVYNLIITNIDPVIILRKIFISLYKKNIDEKTKYKIINSASYYDHNLVRRRREITHLEAFIINTMNLIYESKN
jgi:replication factor C subunit 3/5